MIAKYIHAIGEIAIRVNDMDAMVNFYVDILGFQLRRRFHGDVAAIKLADGMRGQTQTLTLFGPHMPGNFDGSKWPGLSHDTSPLHHFALTIDIRSYNDVIDVLDKASLEYSQANHRWTGWRGIYIRDPEKNIIEFVCYDESIDEGQSGEYDFSKLHGAASGKAFV